MNGLVSYATVSGAVLVAGLLLLEPTLVPGVDGRLAGAVVVVVGIAVWLALQRLDTALVDEGSGTQ